jgi:hypothetical protein
MNDPFNPDPYEDWFEKEIEHRERVFDDPLGDLDILSDIEDITAPKDVPVIDPFCRPDPYLDLLEKEIESTIEPPQPENTIPDPVELAPERFSNYMKSFPDKTPPGLLDRPDRRDAPLNPFKYQLNSGKGSGKSSHKPSLKGKYKIPKSSSEKGVAWRTPCPVARELVTDKDCEKCELNNLEKWGKSPGKEERCNHPEYKDFWDEYYYGPKEDEGEENYY